MINLKKRQNDLRAIAMFHKIVKNYLAMKKNFMKNEISLGGRIIIIALCLIGIAILSCNPAKQLTKAENKVLADIESVKRVRAKTDPLFPIINEIVFTDTGSTKIIRKDSIINVKEYFPVKVWKRASFDTLINGLSFYIDSNGITVTGKYLCPSYEKETHVNGYYLDHRQFNNLKDSLNFYKLQSANLKGQTYQQQTRITELEKQSKWDNQKIWAIGVGSILVIILSHVGRTYLSKISLPKILK